MRILVVDDNEDLVSLLADIIGEEGHTVRTGTNGNQAIALVDEFHPHVVLLDLAMPGLDGFQVCRSLRTDRTHMAMKIIAVTGLDDLKIRSKIAEAGFDLLLRKPVNSEALLEMLETLRVSVHLSEAAGQK